MMAADHPILEKVYKRALVVRVRNELMEGPADFRWIVRSAEGAYPTDVLEGLQELEASGEVCRTPTGGWMHSGSCLAELRTVQCEPGEARNLAACFPEPHPLDFDWRFTERTLELLCNQVIPGGRVAVFGAPTLYKKLIDLGVSAHLYDRNAQVIRSLEALGYKTVVECDLFDFAVKTRWCDCVVADPPWYIEHYRAFLEAARAILVPGGTLLMSVLPRLTRPSACNDRFEIINSASRSGLDLVGVIGGALHYESPPFEVEALRAEGLEVGEWRSGDLFSFVMRPGGPRRKPRRPAAKEQDRWDCVTYRGTTVKIKMGQQDSREPFDFSAASATGEMRLRSVSRRSPTRAKINFWTSRNIALVVNKPELVAEVLRKITDAESAPGVLAISAYEYQLSEAELERLRRLLELLDSETKLG